MTQPISFVVLSTGLEIFKEIRKALSAEGRVQLLAGGNDTDQLYEEIVRGLLVKTANAAQRPQWKADSFFKRYQSASGN